MVHVIGSSFEVDQSIQIRLLFCFILDNISKFEMYFLVPKFIKMFSLLEY